MNKQLLEKCAIISEIPVLHLSADRPKSFDTQSALATAKSIVRRKQIYPQTSSAVTLLEAHRKNKDLSVNSYHRYRAFDTGKIEASSLRSPFLGHEAGHIIDMAKGVSMGNRGGNGFSGEPASMLPSEASASNHVISKTRGTVTKKVAPELVQAYHSYSTEAKINPNGQLMVFRAPKQHAAAVSLRSKLLKGVKDLKPYVDPNKHSLSQAPGVKLNPETAWPSQIASQKINSKDNIYRHLGPSYNIERQQRARRILTQRGSDFFDRVNEQRHKVNMGRIEQNKKIIRDNVSNLHPEESNTLRKVLAGEMRETKKVFGGPATSAHLDKLRELGMVPSKRKVNAVGAFLRVLGRKINGIPI